MSVHLKCDRCGIQEQTRGVMLLARLTGPSIPTVRPELPDGWTRPTLPDPDGQANERELCPQCKADLFRFMAGARVVDDAELASAAMGLASQTPEVCPTCGPTILEPHPNRLNVLRCRNCKEHQAPDLGTGVRPDQVCPGCGHLRHSTTCLNPVAEGGSCGCVKVTDRGELKRLGIEDSFGENGERS